MSADVARRAATEPDAIAAWDDRQALTWREVQALLNRATNALLATPLGQDRRVAVFAENGVETLLAHLAGRMAGCSTVPVNFHLTASELVYILEDSRSDLLLVGPETAEIGIEAAAQTRIPVLGWRAAACAGVGSWESWLASASGAVPPSDMAPRPFLHYTSGTTGRPKGTETPPGIFAGGATVAEHFEHERTMRPSIPNPSGPDLVVGPLYHTGPIRAVRSLGLGRPVVVLGRFDAEATLAAIERHRVSSALMVPTHFVRLLALPDPVRLKYDVSSLESIVHTGAACPVDVKRRMIEWVGPILYESYGATEAGGINGISSQEWLERPGSVGKTLPPFELLVIGDDGDTLGPHEVGTLYFRDTTGRGILYHNDPDKTASAHIEPGVFTVGDVGYVDDEGYVFVTDRRSDLVISGGVNIYPAEAEKVLIEHPRVADVACIGVPDAEMGEELKALVIPDRAASPPDPDELLEFCRERLAHYKCPRSVDFVDDLGRNVLGKIDKRQLRAPYWPSERTIAG